MKTNKLRLYGRAAILAISILWAHTVTAQDEASGRATAVLRIQIDGKRILGEVELRSKKFASEAESMAEFKRNIVQMRRNGSAQLVVEKIDRNGRVTDVTKDTRTIYQSLAPSRLAVSQDGVITAAPVPGAPLGLGGDLAVLIQYDSIDETAWNKAFISIVP